MAKLAGIHKENASLSEITQLLKDNVMSNLNCHNIGRIIEFDSTTQTCTVELMQIKQFNDGYYTPAPITEVPLIMLGAGTGYITMPNPVGTICLLLFLDRNIDNFMETGEQYVPETSRMHDFTDCVALTTFKTLANPLQSYDENAITIFNEQITEEIQSNSSIKVFGNKIQIQTQTTADEPTSSEIVFDDKIHIANNLQSLASLIQSFINACENMTITNGVVSPASKQTFENLKTQFQELLK